MAISFRILNPITEQIVLSGGGKIFEILICAPTSHQIDIKYYLSFISNTVNVYNFLDMKKYSLILFLIQHLQHKCIQHTIEKNKKYILNLSPGLQLVELCACINV